MSAHVLYRFYSSTGQLLYIGITMNPPARFKSHQGTKDWWAQVSGITVETYPTREELVQAERRAIQVERPIHNVIHNGVRKSNHFIEQPPPAAGLTYRCDECHQRVMGGAGYIQVFRTDVHLARSKRLEFEKRNQTATGAVYFNVAELMELPGPAKWYVHHAACDPDPDGDDYHFHVGRADTYPKLLSWTAHLIEKDWLQDTNWGEFLQSRLTKEARTC